MITSWFNVHVEYGAAVEIAVFVLDSSMQISDIR